mgnify:CR=1 FL=1
MGTTRRTFLQVTVFGAAVLALGSVGLGLRGTVYRAPSQPLLALSPAGFSVLAAVAERLLAFGAPDLPPPSALGVAEAVDAHLSTQHPAVAAQVEQVLLLLENAAINAVIEGRVTPFTSLGPDEQDRVLRSWAEADVHLFRTAYRALHGLCMGSYWVSPKLYGAIGYPGPPDFTAVLRQLDGRP